MIKSVFALDLTQLQLADKEGEGFARFHSAQLEREKGLCCKTKLRTFTPAKHNLQRCKVGKIVKDDFLKPNQLHRGGVHYQSLLFQTLSGENCYKYPLCPIQSTRITRSVGQF